MRIMKDNEVTTKDDDSVRKHFGPVVGYLKEKLTRSRANAENDACIKM